MTSRGWTAWGRVAGGSCAAAIFLLGLISGGLAGCGSGGKFTGPVMPAGIPENWEFTLTNSGTVMFSGGVVPMGVS
ncbi:MAG: hypothetical protein ACYCPD_12535, partial [Acidobacteriaceae bacterium]